MRIEVHQIIFSNVITQTIDADDVRTAIQLTDFRNIIGSEPLDGMEGLKKEINAQPLFLLDPNSAVHTRYPSVFPNLSVTYSSAEVLDPAGATGDEK